MLDALRNVQFYLEYDPEHNWSCVDYNEQQLLKSIVQSVAEDDLSIRHVLQTARLPLTPSRCTWVKHLMITRFAPWTTMRKT
jgi:hypothetical protein